MTTTYTIAEEFNIQARIWQEFSSKTPGFLRKIPKVSDKHDKPDHKIRDVSDWLTTDFMGWFLPVDCKIHGEKLLYYFHIC